MESQSRPKNNKVKTTVLFEKNLLEEIDQFNPFRTRKEFLDNACKRYLKELRKQIIDHKLAKACSDASEEDGLVNEEWESASLEEWT
jgi:metal-responsive CopG/Arc/MetJ family transcriptional regulator